MNVGIANSAVYHKVYTVGTKKETSAEIVHVPKILIN